MKPNKTLVPPLAALLVVAVAGAVLATSTGNGDADTVVPAAASASPDPSADTTVKPERDTALTDVLDDLVAKGTITASQKAAILDALTAEREARRAERQDRLEQMRDILADGQITQAELDSLPADSPFRLLGNLDELMADGKITTDELRSLGRMFGRGFGFDGQGGRGFGFGFDGQGGRGFGHGMGPGGMWGGPDDGTATPDASASPTISG